MLWRLLIAYEIANLFVFFGIVVTLRIKEKLVYKRNGYDCKRDIRMNEYFNNNFIPDDYDFNSFRLLTIGGYIAVRALCCYYDFLDEEAKLRGEKA